jgi:hypothetical protein
MFILLFRNHETLTFVRSVEPETAVRHGDTTAGRKLADAETTTAAAGCGDDAVMGKSARATLGEQGYSKDFILHKQKMIFNRKEKMPLPPYEQKVF